jgi:protein involved in polysaccharide export with SLBB domain
MNTSRLAALLLVIAALFAPSSQAQQSIFNTTSIGTATASNAGLDSVSTSTGTLDGSLSGDAGHGGLQAPGVGSALPRTVPAAAAARLKLLRSSSGGGGKPAVVNPVPDQSAPLPAAALPDNEFQKFVTNATGTRLPIFGLNLFDQGASGFAPLDRTPVPADYLLGPGDELYVRVWGSVDLDVRTQIDRNGLINLPRVGSIPMAGVKAAQAEDVLRGQIGRVWRNFSLNVTPGQLRSMTIFVVGQARRPGSYTVSSLSTLVNAVFASGGPGPNGSLRRIQLRREGQLLTELDLYDFIIAGNAGQDTPLRQGDTLVYLPRGPQVAITGSSDTRAIFELRNPQEPMLQVLAYGGLTRPAISTPQASLERIDPHAAGRPRQVERVNLDSPAGALPQLRDGDIVTLFGASPAFANAVTLRGNVAQPLRHPFAAGMRISDLIPDREALITPGYFQRKNRLVQFTSSGMLKGGADDQVDTHAVEGEVRNIVDEPNWEFAVIERLNSDDLTMQVLPFNLGRAVLQRDPEHNLLLQAGDVITIFSLNDINNPVSRRTRLVRVEGEVQAPGVYQVKAGESLQGLLRRIGGITADAYVFGTEFNRASTRVAQQAALDEAVRRLESQLTRAGADQAANLVATDAQSAAQLRAAQLQAARDQLDRLKSLRSNGRIALELHPDAASLSDLPDIPLEDGDRIYVPHRPAFVLAVGAVTNSNGLLWRPGKRVRDYLNLAGVERDADENGLFVVRADGSVDHASRRGGWFDSMEDLVLMPGDTMVMPEKTDRETAMTAFTRGLKDWSQILYQFGLAAVALNTLRK